MHVSTYLRRSSHRFAVLAGALVLAPLLGGCAGYTAETGPPAAPWRFEHTSHQGRAYLLYVPTSFPDGAPYPLVVVLHASSSGSVDAERLTALNGLAEREHLIVAYPEARDGTWRFVDPPDSGAANDGAANDDAAYVVALAEHIATLWPVDPDRVYLTGFAEGAAVGYAAVCRDGHGFTAFAAVAGALPGHLQGLCRQADPLPVLTMVGTDDPVVPFAGGVVSTRGQPVWVAVGAEETTAFWRTRNGCGTDAGASEVLDAVAEDGTRVRHARWTEACPSAELETYVVEGGGHAWPPGVGQRRQLGTQGVASRELDATKAVWAFFSRQRRARQPQPDADGAAQSGQ